MAAASAIGILGAIGELTSLAAEAASSITIQRSREIREQAMTAWEKYQRCLLDFDVELARHNREAAERIAALPLDGPVRPTVVADIKVRLKGTDIVFFASRAQLDANPDKLEIAS